VREGKQMGDEWIRKRGGEKGIGKKGKYRKGKRKK
jgi:hypothetical protein